MDEEEINGIYDDDGNKINPDLIPIPGLCLTCKSYYGDDWEENILCTLNRADQKGEKEFKCGAYEKNT